MQRHKGFTIVELIVVIAIIAVLAAVVLIGVTKYITEARNAAASASSQQIPLSAQNYIDNNGSSQNWCSSSSSNFPNIKANMEEGGYNNINCNGAGDSLNPEYCTAEEWLVLYTDRDGVDHCVAANGSTNSRYTEYDDHGGDPCRCALNH